MALSPLDIRNKTFSTKMRGFSPEEVDDFLDQVINDYEEVLRQNRDLEKNVKHLEEKLRYFNELKEALNQSIIVAQETADKVKDSAQKEADVIVADANNEASELLTKANQEANETLTDAQKRADKMIKDATERANFLINDATAKANSLASETDDLKKKTRSFHQRLTLLLESQLELVKSDEWDDLLRPFSSYVTDEHQNFKNSVDMTRLEQHTEVKEQKELPQRQTRAQQVEKTTNPEPVKTPEPTIPVTPVVEPEVEVEEEATNNEFLGQTMALDRSALNESMSRQSRRQQANVNFQETTSIELPKLKRRSKK